MLEEKESGGKEHDTKGGDSLLVHVSILDDMLK